MNEYIGIAVGFILAGVITGAMVVLASTLGKKKPSPVKSEPFECGKNPFSLPGGKLAIKFYLTAILFILFDVELIFLARKKGYKITQIPVKWRYVASQRVNPAKDSIRMLIDILKIRLAYLTGKYNSS